MNITRIPCDLEKSMPSRKFCAPRIPIWMVRVGSSTPASTARRNGAPCVNFEPKNSPQVSVCASTCTMPTGRSAPRALKVGEVHVAKIGNTAQLIWIDAEPEIESTHQARSVADFARAMSGARTIGDPEIGRDTD